MSAIDFKRDRKSNVWVDAIFETGLMPHGFTVRRNSLHIMGSLLGGKRYTSAACAISLKVHQ